jgi:NitT/TauT family transport system ATP-binding protein
MEVTVQELTKSWSSGPSGQMNALDPISYRFRSGQFTCLLGPSGCGKSTLIKIIGGLEAASSGTIEIRDPASGDAKKIGTCSIMMWQGLNLFPWRTVIDNVAFGPEMAGISRDERYTSARSILTTVGLQKFADHFPRQLSGGMRQRVALARALMTGRPILLMDEPFAALDAQTKIVMQMELLRLFESMKKTVLFVTHAIEEAILLGDEILVMTARPGQIKEVIKVDLPRPRSLDLVKTPAFGVLFDRAFHLIREEVAKAMEEQATTA